ncbi:MAG TPA: tetratricopeptide repeat protein [Alphaproteobacteria bacterium]|nr:tetratricopeptide repeat protein [Alphaproteobacteria bacterium]
MVFFIVILVVLATLAFLGYPIIRRDWTYAPEQREGLARVAELRAEKERWLRAIKDLEFDLASGKLSPEDYTAMRATYDSRAVAVLRELDVQEALLRETRPLTPQPGRQAASPARASRPVWARPAFVTSVVGGLVIIVGGGGFLLGRVTQDQPPGAMAREGMPDNNAQMVAALEAQLTQNPRDINALVGLGRVYLQTGQMPKAIEMYRRALEVDSNNVSALSGMAMILAQAGHSDQALMLFDKALAINPQMPMALLFKGRILYEAKQDYNGAIATWEAFLQIMPQGGPAEVVRGWIDEARQEARKLQDKGPPTKVP